MIVITGGAGFIGSALVWELNRRGFDKIIVVDNLDSSEKWKNLRALNYCDYYSRDQFINMIENDRVAFNIPTIVHFGACSVTTEKDSSFLMENNYKYSKKLYDYAMKRDIRFLYASSAATYGDGERGFDDNEDNLNQLRPLNMYGYSKHLFDRYVKKRDGFKKSVGLKFFNVFGPNEYHKGAMCSKIFKSYHEVLENGNISLFKSEDSEKYPNGDSKRDFVYVKDVVSIVADIMSNHNINGLFNIGTGTPRSWNDLAKAVFKSMGKSENINYIDMPENLKGKYQYYTCASNEKINMAGDGNKARFRSLEESVEDYVKNYLIPNKFLGDE
ncbi:MAG: ADP-glyceromanno-heptose 6-epimerase [Candidatus Cloacimonadota bacterium]|nr:MAG: ADP-glyceromanno-heptose 6-epimerase [Candidatus Cloacimonadota bacterium]PIE81413.1 MAG: ADP-glyceromanno-heptose 6-epimerase [Candidatus Delongbacteria bacterium]